MRKVTVILGLAIAAALVWLTGPAITRSQRSPVQGQAAIAPPRPSLTPVPQVGRTGSALAFRPDGAQLATLSEHSVLVWDVATGSIAARFEDPVAPQRDGIVTYSPDGTVLAYSGERGIIVADAHTHEVIAELTDPGEPPEAMAFSLEAWSTHTRRLYGVFSGKLALWDAQRWTSLVPPQVGAWNLAPALAAHPDGYRLAVADRKERRIYVVRETGGEPPCLIDCGGEPDPGAAFHELHFIFWMGRHDVILARDGRGSISLWDTDTCQAVPQRSGLQDIQVQGVAVCQSKPRLAVWNSPHLATFGGLDGLAIWDCDTGEQVGQLPRGTSPEAAAFSPDGRLLATTDGRAAQLWDADTARQAGAFGLCAAPPVGQPAVSPDGRALACITPDRRVAVWNLVDGRLNATPGPPVGTAAALGFSLDGSRVVAGDANVVAVWEAASGELVTAIEFPDPAEVTATALAPGNDLLAVASRPSTSDPCTLQVFDATTGEPVRELVGETQGSLLRSLRFTPDGARLLVTGLAGIGTKSHHSYLALIDAKTGALIWERRDASGLYFADDGRRILIHTGRAFAVLDTNTGAPVEQPDVGFVANSPMVAPDGASLICFSNQQGIGPRVYLLEPFTWRAISEAPLRLRGVSVPGSRGLWFAVARRTGIELCDARTGDTRVTLWTPPVPDEKGRPTWDGDWLAFTPDGYYSGSEGAGRHLRFRDEAGSLHTTDEYPHLQNADRVREALTW